MNKKSKNNRKQHSENKTVSQILNFFKNHPGQGYTAKQLVRKLTIKGKSRIELVDHTCLELVQNEKLKKVGDLYQSMIDVQNTYVGKVDHVNARFAFIVCDELEKDIKVSGANLNGAVDSDVVRVSIIEKSHKRGANEEGAVVEVIERGRKELVGVIEISDKFAFVVADNKKIHEDIFVHKSGINGAHQNDKVIVRITEWARDGKRAEGKVAKVLGKAGLHEVEMHAILAEFDLPTVFPKAVEEESEQIPLEIPEKEISNRKDLRKTTTFTIDPIDAKDFDDAISMQKLKNGHWEIGVHIADVTHYVKEGSLLEKEAYKRATSVYLVDRVIPMLPERLSNGLCSLRPNEDKLCFSALFEMDDEGKIYKEWFGRTAIHSDRRFTYEDAQEIIETKQGDFAEEVLKLNEIAYALREKRFQQGAIGFETTEVRFKLDENGKPLEVVPKVRKDSHKLVEDFMLLANKKVAEFVFNKNGKDKDPLTMVYRVHENPNPERLAAFAKFAGRFGHTVKLDDKSIAHSINKLVLDIEGKPEEDVLQQLAIRSMAKARYTTETLGHFGLSFEHYSHFTSPIRRYPDMMAHRLLARYLKNKKTADEKETEDQCKHSSDQERMASEAERASIKYKQVEFMKNQDQDKIFEGIVSGLTEWGVYVEAIETKCEGMVRIGDMDDDYYEYDADNLRIVGKKNKRMITFGDKVKVKILKTDLRYRTIDFTLIWE